MTRPHTNGRFLEVQVLEDELEGLPSAEEAQRILDSYDQAQTDEENLDDQILDLEIEVALDLC